MKADRARPVHLDGTDQLVAMLDAARELDADPHRHTTGRHALVATLMFAGPRATEASELLVRDLDLARGRLDVGRSKTDAGMRSIDIVPVLLGILKVHKADHRGGLDAPLFPTATGSHRDKDNIRKRVLEPVIARAGELLAEARTAPAPGWRDAAQAAPQLRVDPRRARPRPGVRDGSARAHRPGLHAAGLRPRDALLRRRARAPEGSRRGPRMGTSGHYGARNGPGGAGGMTRLMDRFRAAARFLVSGRSRARTADLLLVRQAL
jgi:hypothetical protein